MMPFSEHIPVVKWHMTIFPMCLLLKQWIIKVYAFFTTPTHPKYKGLEFGLWRVLTVEQGLGAFKGVLFYIYYSPWFV